MMSLGWAMCQHSNRWGDSDHVYGGRCFDLFLVGWITKECENLRVEMERAQYQLFKSARLVKFLPKPDLPW